MKAILISSILALAANFACAAPTPTENVPEIVERDVEATYTPIPQVQIKEATPNYAYGDSIYGEVSRVNDGSNIQTLFSFTLPADTAGKTCKFKFAYPYYLSGSKTAQLFTVGGAVTTGATYNWRPYRDQHIATFTAVYGDNASFTYYAPGIETFPCWAGETRGFELVSVGDNDSIKWVRPNGLQIVAY